RNSGRSGDRPNVVTTIGSVGERPDRNQSPRPPVNRSPRFTCSQSGQPCRSSDTAAWIVAFGLCSVSPLFASLPLLELTYTCIVSMLGASGAQPTARPGPGPGPGPLPDPPHAAASAHAIPHATVATARRVPRRSNVRWRPICFVVGFVGRFVVSFVATAAPSVGFVATTPPSLVRHLQCNNQGSTRGAPEGNQRAVVGRVSAGIHPMCTQCSPPRTG